MLSIKPMRDNSTGTYRSNLLRWASLHSSAWFLCFSSVLLMAVTAPAPYLKMETQVPTRIFPIVRNISNLFFFQGATLVSVWRNTEESIGVMSTPTLTVLTRDFQAEAEDHSSSITQRRLALLEQITRWRLHLLLHIHPSENMNIMIEYPETRPTPEN